MEKYTKPFLTLDQQIENLKSKGLIFTDEASAKDYLQKVGYYRLSGYWHSLRKSKITTDSVGNEALEILDTFHEGSEFSHIVELYMFDKKLRQAMLDALERLEISLRTAIALQIGQYSPWAYRDPKYFYPDFSKKIPDGWEHSRFETLLTKFDKKVTDSKSEFVSHHRQKYSDPVPIWVATELWDFGMLANILNGLRNKDKDAIADLYTLPKASLLTSWIHSLNFLRNVCAHHSRLWNKPLVIQPKNTQLNDVPLLDHLVDDDFAHKHFYSGLAITQFLQLQVSPNSNWGNRVKDITDQFPEAPGITLKQAGFPENWKDMPLWNT